MNKIRFVGLDVHKNTVSIAVADYAGGPADFWSTVESSPERVLKELRKLGPVSTLRCCYEAGPTGYGLQRHLLAAGIECIVVAPALVPSQGTRIKTDRRDAAKLAHFLRSGDLTAIEVPDEQTEAIRDLVRARDDARLAERTARQQLLKFLDRHGRRFTEGKEHWTKTHMDWIQRQHFDQEAQRRVLADAIQTVEKATARIANLDQDISDCITSWAVYPIVKNLQAFRGVRELTAVGVVAEVFNFVRFSKAPSLMAFVGLVPSESSSGNTRRQGGITKTGNRHVRRLLIEAGWHYYSRPAGVSAVLRKRREGIPPEIIEIADRAQRRLCRKAYQLRDRRKPPNQIVAALARELAGFIWAAARASIGIPPQPNPNSQRKKSLVAPKTSVRRPQAAAAVNS